MIAIKKVAGPHEPAKSLAKNFRKLNVTKARLDAKRDVALPMSA
jgi:hypothetical protein